MAKTKETQQLSFQRKINRAYTEVIRPEPSQAGIFQRQHNLLSHCIYFNPGSVHRAAGQAWCSEITCAGDWCHQALTLFWFSNALGSITLEKCSKYFLHPYQYKSTERGSSQPLGHRSHSGHCDSTISLLLPSGQAASARWDRLEHGQGPFLTLQWDTGCTHLPVSSWRATHSWADQQGKPPLPSRGLCQGGTLRDTSTMDRQLRPFRNIFQGICKPCQSEGLYTAHPAQALPC